MKVTFPHMGNIYLPLKGLFDDLGVETVIPPKCSKRTSDMGIRLSPELICLPFKINLGNYLESIEKGADTIIIPGGCGPCRLGFYGQVLKEILHDNNIDVEVIVLEAPDAEFGKFFNTFKRIILTRNPFKIGRSFKNALRLLNKLNIFEEIMLRNRPYEKDKGTIKNLHGTLIDELENSRGSISMLKTMDRALYQLNSTPIIKNREDVIRVGIVGEIYTVLEDSVNFNIIERLNDMGVEVHKSLTTGEWLTENLNRLFSRKSKRINPQEAAKTYINSFVGGHGRESVGNAVIYGQKGFDGVIHLMPFNCMPEIVALSILSRVHDESNVPILTLVLDEMTGEAGYVTRLEAYIDLLKTRKKKYQETEDKGNAKRMPKAVD